MWILLLGVLAPFLPLHAEEAFVAGLGKVVPSEGLVRVAVPSLEGLPPIVDKVWVTPGQSVKAGDLLAVHLLMPLLSARVAAAQAEAEAAKAARETVIQELPLIEAEQKLQQTALDALADQRSQRRQALVEAQTALGEAESERDLQMNRLQGQISRSSRERESLEQIIRENTPSKSDRIDLEHQIRVLNASIQSLQSEEKALEKRLKAAVTSAEARVETARQAVGYVNTQEASEQARLAVLEARKGPMEKRAEEARLRLLASESQIKTLEALRSLAEIRAPHAGRIVRLCAQAGEMVGTEGLCLLAPDGPIRIRSEVYENDLPAVAIGQKATVTCPAFKEVLTGTVDRVEPLVGPLALFDNDPSAFTDRRVGIVWIMLEDSESRLVKERLNSTVNLRIRVRQ